MPFPKVKKPANELKSSTNGHKSDGENHSSNNSSSLATAVDANEKRESISGSRENKTSSNQLPKNNLKKAKTEEADHDDAATVASAEGENISRHPSITEFKKSLYKVNSNSSIFSTGRKKLSNLKSNSSNVSIASSKDTKEKEDGSNNNHNNNNNSNLTKNNYTLRSSKLAPHNHRGFHSRPSDLETDKSQTVPPLKHPIKPSGHRARRTLKHTSGGIFNKLLSSNPSSRRESLASNTSSNSGGSVSIDPLAKFNPQTRKSDPEHITATRESHHHILSPRHFSTSTSSSLIQGFQGFRLSSPSSRHMSSYADSSIGPVLTEESPGSSVATDGQPSPRNITRTASLVSEQQNPSKSIPEMSQLQDFSDLSQVVSSANFQSLNEKNGSIQSTFPNDPNALSNWVPPESWNVKLDAADAPVPPKDTAAPRSTSLSSTGSSVLQMTAPSDSFRATKAKNNENSESRRSSRVAETKSLAQAPPESPKTDKKPIASSVPSISRRSVIRVFKEDNSFTTIPCEIEITTAELIPKLKKKFFFNKADDYQLTLRTGGLSRALEPFEKPLKIQIHYLLLSGYTVNDKLDLLGREDLSYLVKFSIEKCDFKQLSDEQKNHITKDFIHVNLSDLQLQSVPLVLYQRTFDIESLDISRNPSMAIPLDFIQACNNLTKLIYSGNRAHKIPSNIFEASKLTYLDLKINFLSEIPSQIESLSNLTTLQLSCNQLSSLPKSFGNLKKLNFLNLSSNNFKVYPEIVSELENLKELDLSYNELKQIPISISHLSQLEKLNFSANKLTKELPAYLGTLVKLKFLDLRYNNITNIESLTALPELEVLYTTSNNITQFDDELQKVRLFELNRNPLTSITVKNHLETLVILDLSKAKLTSLTANFFTNIPNLEKVILDNNHLVTLPSDICSLKRLVYLSCVRNNLSSLPPGISSLTSLQYLDLHLNNINVLSPEIWNLSSLSILNLSSNLLQDFPKPAANFFSSRITEVDSISKERNSSSDSVSPLNSRRPSALVKNSDSSNYVETGNLSESSPPISEQFLSDSLLYLSISDNRIDDQSLQVFSLFSRLKSLNLSYNEIIEIPPGTLKKMDSLTYLYLSGNKLSSLPSDDLEHLQNLMILHLNGNRFHSLPSELSKISHLSVLDVGSNQLKYNISNWPYDWNWNWNGDLKYLNFSGNKRLEIKPSHNKDVTLHGDLDSFLGLKNLKVLGLMDVTLITQKVPDQTVASRIRTTASEFSRFGYGISDTLGSSDGVTTRDVVLDKFRNNENEILISIFDGKNGDDKQGHKIAKIIQETFAMIFADELKKDESSIYDALRRSFLTMNREINSIIIKSDASTFSSVTPAHRTSTTYDLTSHDGLCGCCATVIYIKDKTLYTANIGDTMAMLTRSNGEHLVLTTEHLPYSQGEYDRIRATGGFVNSDGKLDGTVDVSRAVGFFNLLPHIHSGPDISVLELSPSDEMIAIGTKELWKYVSYDFAVDVIRQEKNNPMLAAEKLRDYAISYGASDKVTAVVISLNKDNSVVLRRKAEENENLLKFRRNKSSLPEDTALRRLEQEIEPPVGEVAMVFTDIKNSTLLWDNFPIAMRSAIKTHNSIMRRQLRIVGGYEVKTEGDAFMVSFPTATSALLWCFSVQQQLLIADWPTEIIESDQGCEISDEANNLIFRGLSVRMGAHWGIPVCETDIITKRMDYFGPMVNRTSRISGVADGGQITLSSDFLFEFNKIKACHDKSKTTSIREAYGEEYGNMAVTLDKEVTQLENIGWVIENIGEMKLKGLETPESITLIYARPLASRFKFNEADTPANSSVSVNGILNTDLFWKLRTLGLRLEQIASYLSAGVSDRDCKNYSTFETTTTNTLSNRMTNIDFLTLMDHIITRIESIVLMIKVRQELGISNLILSNNDVYAMVAKEFQTLKELKRQLT